MNIQVSNGELVDKVTILKIKSEKIKDEHKLSNVLKEYNYLKTKMHLIKITEQSSSYLKLYDVNLKLWKIEDDIRAKHQLNQHDQQFIDLAVSVFVTNDLRAKIKKEINLNTNSELVEEKSYQEYSKN